MDKGLVFFTLAALCFWLVLDDFFGKKRVSAVAANLLGTTNDNAPKTKEEFLQKRPFSKQAEKEQAPQAEKDYMKEFEDIAAQLLPSQY